MYDILRATKQRGAYAEFDATKNYDRMVPALVVLTWSILGLGMVPGKMLLDSLEHLVHKLRLYNKIIYSNVLLLMTTNTL